MIDLHVHSTYSDGSLTPEELVAMAVEAGLVAMAITDHDTVGGVRRFVEAAANTSLRAIAGVEISAEFAPGTMHILGYGVDPNDISLNRHLQWIRDGREARNREILGKLMDLGFHITWEDVLAFSGEEVIGRPHFYMALKAAGYVKNKKEAFSKYLAKGKPGYADRRRLPAEESIELIRDAGGIAVLAHPFTLHLGRWELRKELKYLSERGLQGLECYYSENTDKEIRQYLKLAKDYGLIATGGTDFHGEITPDIKLGRGFGNLHIPDSILPAIDALLAKI